MLLGDHLYRIGNDIVAAYLVVTDEGITIIDAGLAGHWKDLKRELAALGRPLSDVRGIVLTHGDTDHIGFAERLRRETGIPVYVHADDAARARGTERAKAALASAGRFRLKPTAGFLAYTVRKGGWRTTYLADVVPVQDGDVLDLPGSPRIIGLPGHSPGSVAVHVPAARALFVGDALTTRHVLSGKTGLQPSPFTDDPARALEVLDRLTGLADVDWVLPGHGTPWNGPVNAVADGVRAGA
ncbi:MBL fold metallo-hydrolase [Arthrobacter caoxuetaonis]|uniref:MBL fold metallo-hydrolase n=1 Tax=Arthrobacter caoxuetaonis TaxID=2886935 RepID=UPI001D137452|nr:MBL fold metallo-hydrolase [Arthrobacter caoxuetaonis]MCC3282041.1 MBL fold metallo-hydrolase [Arthrobacter caoxuetaonis]